jgi:hypothetical protein
MEQQSINLREKRDVGQVINATFSFLRLAYMSMLKDILIIAGPFYLLAGMALAYSTYQVTATLGLMNPFVRNPFFTRYAQYLTPWYSLYNLLFWAGTALSFTICANYVYQYNRANNSMDFPKEEVRKSLTRNFFRVLGAQFLMIIVFVGGLFLLFVPGVYWGVANILAPAVVSQEENVDALSALGASRRLISNNWWRSLGLGILVSLITGIIMLGFSLPNYILNFIVSFHWTKGNNSDNYQVFRYLFSALSVFGYAVIAPISATALCIYYYSLKEEKEHIGLMKEIDSIGTVENKNTGNEGSY